MRRKRFCGARTRRGTPCQCKAIETKRGAWRCRLHGGFSTGPKTAEGRARIAAAVRQRGSSYTPELPDRRSYTPELADLSTGPKSPEGKARISAAARQRWAAYRAGKAAAEMKADTG
jgi:hypothetical protein